MSRIGCTDKEQIMHGDIHYWQPRVMRHSTNLKKEEYAIHEVYFNINDEVITYTCDALSSREASVELLKTELIKLRDYSTDEIILGDYGYIYDKEDIVFWLEFIDKPVIDFDDTIHMYNLIVDGEIVTDKGDSISSSLTKSTFTRGRLYDQAEIFVENKYRVSYKLREQYLHKLPCTIILYFVIGRLNEIHIYPEWKGSTDKWTIDHTQEELKRQKLNEDWLKQLLGEPPYQYYWGEVVTIFDEKSGCSSVIIRYKVA